MIQYLEICKMKGNITAREQETVKEEAVPLAGFIRPSPPIQNTAKANGVETSRKDNMKPSL